jgi:molybdopterin molybdotransferase
MNAFVGHGRDEVTLKEELVTVEEHLAAILAMLPTPEPIELRTADGLGLILAETATCEVTLPAVDNSAMDGYAVVADDLSAATRAQPVRLEVIGEIVAGGPETLTVARGTCVRIMTGAPIPPGADTVVPVELTVAEDDGGTAVFHLPPRVGDNIRHAGEDLVPGRELVAAGRRIAPADVALLSAAGVTRVVCLPAPRVVIMSTGDELVPAEREPEPGRLRDSNGPMLAAMVKATGGVPFVTGAIPDDEAALTEAFESNLGHADLFVCTGGASAGTRDLLPGVIGALGEVESVKVAMRPGMPQIRGRIGSTPVIGLPGNPVSSFVSFEVFVRPAIRALQGRRDVHRPTVVARAIEPLHAPAHKRGYLRVRLARDGAGWTVRPTGAQGSHLISSIAQADGLAIVPEAVDEVRVGDEVRVMLLVD